MKQLVVICLAAIFFPACKPGGVAAGKATRTGWVSLFNGHDLKDWQPKFAGHALGENYANTFRVQDGLLSTRYDGYDRFNNSFGALYYLKKFKDFRLKVVYRFVGDTTAGAPAWGYRDGGIQYFGQPPATIKTDQPFPICLEYNLLGGNGKEARATGEICASGMYVNIGGSRNTSYCTPPTVKRTYAGDQWVTAEIDVHGDTVKHFVNGEQILVFTHPRYDTAHSLGKAFIVNGDADAKDGYISIQSNSNPMDFKTIEILEY